MTAKNPLKRNPGLQPEVLGPGEKVTIKLKTDIHSVGGRWRGNLPTVKLLNNVEIGGPAEFTVTTNVESWGKTLAAKDRDLHDPIDPWVKVTIPNDAQLGGKLVRLQVKLPISFPVESGNHTYNENTATLQKDVEINLAEPGLLKMYRGAWSVGMGVGLGCSLLGGILLTMLAKSMKDQAHPNVALPLWTPGGNGGGARSPPWDFRNFLACKVSSPEKKEEG